MTIDNNWDIRGKGCFDCGNDLEEFHQDRGKLNDIASAWFCGKCTLDRLEEISKSPYTLCNHVAPQTPWGGMFWIPDKEENPEEYEIYQKCVELYRNKRE
jgi:hypothetical protein